LKFFRGLALIDLVEASGGVVTSESYVTGDGRLRTVTAQGGKGFGLDAGLSGPLGRQWICSLVLRDLGSQLVWTRRAQERLDTFHVPGLSLGAEGQTTIHAESTRRPLRAARLVLPPLFSCGVARSAGSLLTSLRLDVATADGWGASTRPQISAGQAWRCWDGFVLRFHTIWRRADPMRWGLGAGLALGPTQLDVGFASAGSFSPSAGYGLGFATSLTLFP
jgi:hypothetical protein